MIDVMKLNRIDLQAIRISNEHHYDVGLNFQIKKKIGKGSEGEVFLALNTETGKELAIKFTREVRSFSCTWLFHQKLIKLDHQNVVKYQQIKRTHRDTCCIIMEKCDEDLLQKIINCPQKALTEEVSRRIISQLIQGLEACHQNNIFHGDLKPDNILLLNDVVKLTDFNIELDALNNLQLTNPESCNDKDTNATKRRNFKRISNIFGSYEYLSPEIMCNIQQNSDEIITYNFAAIDIWSLGVTLFIMISGTMPWERAVDSDPDYSRYLQDRPSFWPVSFSKELQLLLMDMLHPCPINRIKLTDIKKHLWLCEFNPTLHSMTSSVQLHTSTSDVSQENIQLVYPEITNNNNTVLINPVINVDSSSRSNNNNSKSDSNNNNNDINNNNSNNNIDNNNSTGSVEEHHFETDEEKEKGYYTPEQSPLYSKLLRFDVTSFSPLTPGDNSTTSTSTISATKTTSSTTTNSTITGITTTLPSRKRSRQELVNSSNNSNSKSRNV